MTAMDKDYLPPHKFVSAEVLADVFGDGEIPFETNEQGAVAVEAYLAWLQKAGQDALAAFDKHSEVVLVEQSDHLGAEKA
jgi:hypothetical protein